MPTVLILGAYSDMGQAIARKFAQEGYNILLAARYVQRLAPLQSDLTIRYNISCSSFNFEATDFSSHTTFYKTLPEKPDIAICVFGYMNDNENVIDSEEETLKTIHVNYTGAVNILNIIARDYLDRKTGTIVGISSVAGERGRQSNYIYGSAKAGFTTYLSGLRNRLFRDNVHVLTVLPGFVYTKMTEHLTLPKLLTAYPQDIANAIYNGVQKKKNVIYVKWFWRWIMLIIKLIPEAVFKKLKL